MLKLIKYVIIFIISGSIMKLLIDGSFVESKSLIYNIASMSFMLFAIMITAQAAFTIYWMLYGWDNDKSDDLESYIKIKPELSFSMILPGRHEEAVIADTIQSVANIDYPSNLKEIVIVLSDDDTETISEVERMMYSIDYCKIKLILYKGPPFSKPIGLNHAVTRCEGDIVTIFDAEDEVSEDILKIVNGKFVKEKLDVMQSGVQLMNIYTNWFSTLNCLEYLFWFKSALKFFASKGVVPLGGNTVFIKRKYIYEIGGWDVNNLTEDCDIGLRLSEKNLNFGVFYHHSISTREETPDTVQSFIKQRTRWLQGFLQIAKKGTWYKQKNLQQKVLSLYILFATSFNASFIFYIILSIVLTIFLDFPVLVPVLQFVPLILLFMQMTILSWGLYDFTKKYNMSYKLYLPLKIFISFIPYVLLIYYASFRAFYREISGVNNWEKTEHSNLHRKSEILIDKRVKIFKE